MMASRSKSTTLTDHDEIRSWAEERDAKPSCVKGTGDEGDIGILRLDFPGYSGGDSLQEIEWDDWLEKFNERGLALLVQETTADGQQSNFNKLISRRGNSASASGRGRSTGSRGGRSASTARKSSGRASSARGGRSASTSRASSRSRKAASVRGAKKAASKSASPRRTRATSAKSTRRRSSAKSSASQVRRGASTATGRKSAGSSSRKSTRSAGRTTSAKRGGSRVTNVSSIRRQSGSASGDGRSRRAA